MCLSLHFMMSAVPVLKPHLPPANEVLTKVMFLHLSVILSTGFLRCHFLSGFLVPYSFWGRGFSTPCREVLYKGRLPGQRPTLLPPDRDLYPQPPVMASSGGHWSGRYVSYWNAYLCCRILMRNWFCFQNGQNITCTISVNGRRNWISIFTDV